MHNAILMIGRSYNAISNEMYGISLCTHDREKPFSALFQLTEERYQLKDNYKVGFVAAKKRLYRSEDYYLMDLESIMKSWIVEAPECGYYQPSPVNVSDIQTGDVLVVDEYANSGTERLGDAFAARIEMVNGELRLVAITSSGHAQKISFSDLLKRKMAELQDKGELALYRLIRLEDDHLRKMVEQSREAATC
ncbi:hypothetical protein D3C79_34650 [compost metagenome]